MIRKLQIKFMVIIMLILSVVFIVIFSAINIITNRAQMEQTRKLMSNIAREDGFPHAEPFRPREPNDADTPTIRIFGSLFYVRLNPQHQIFSITARGNTEYSETEIQNMVTSVLKEKNPFGTIKDVYYLSTEKPYGKIIIFLDNHLETRARDTLLWTTTIIGLITLFILFFISLFLSSWAIRPVQQAFETQKIFIADVSHELKTPLTTMATNAFVLSNEIGQNKWLEYIQSEVERMRHLVDHLLYLAKSDKNETLDSFTTFSLSEAVLLACLPFESTAFESNKNLSLDVSDGLFYYGDEQRLKQVVIILLDNAIKHCDENGTIIVSLNTHNNKKMIKVYNTGKGISKELAPKIFQRFYRGDDSRNRETGGYGLGLSIAQAIIEKHNGKIYVEGKEGEWIQFVVELPKIYPNEKVTHSTRKTLPPQ